jgi:hypothetical protein
MHVTAHPTPGDGDQGVFVEWFDTNGAYHTHTFDPRKLNLIDPGTTAQ